MAHVSIPATEHDRLVKSDQMLKHLIDKCTYVEDGSNSGNYWAVADNISLVEYLEQRVQGIDVPVDGREEVEDDGNLCPACNGSGEGVYDGSRCPSCLGRGEL